MKGNCPLTSFGFIDGELAALTGRTALETVGLGIDGIPAVERAVALESEVVTAGFIDSDMGNVPGKDTDEVAERQSSDARKSSQKSDKLESVRISRGNKNWDGFGTHGGRREHRAVKCKGR